MGAVYTGDVGYVNDSVFGVLLGPSSGITWGGGVPHVLDTEEREVNMKGVPEGLCSCTSACNTGN